MGFLGKREPSFLSVVESRIDWKRFSGIQSKYLTEEHDEIGPLKYFDHNKYLRINIDRAAELKLHEREPADILDIGCGFGYFLFIAKEMGHEVVGMDFMEGNHSDTASYSEMIDMFGVERKLHRIERFEPLSFTERKFDLITAFQIF
jgi:2-polyprenyl-3-methyl-5-hydroxy-6-metoxy-1,4-benzoquinol methylase